MAVTHYISKARSDSTIIKLTETKKIIGGKNGKK